VAMIVSLAGLLPCQLGAERHSSALAGSIADQSGAMLPAAQVKATEVNTGAVRIVQSNAAGRFLFSQSIREPTALKSAPQDSALPCRSRKRLRRQTAIVNFTLSLAPLAGGRSRRAIRPNEPGEREHVDDARSQDNQEPANPGKTSLRRAVRRGRVDEYGGLVE